MKSIQIFLFFCLTSFHFSATRHVVKFAPSVAKYFGFQMDRFVDVASEIHFAKPSFLARMGIINADAEASYNSKLNVIELRESNFVKVSRFKARVKSVEELKADAGYMFSVKISTIMHEMAHAEMDHFILKKVSNQDKKLADILKKEVKPWIKRNSKLSSSIGIYELHGYFVGQIIETMHNDMGDIYLYNGINSYSGKFFAGKLMKQKAKELPLEEFTQLFVPESRADISYGDRIRVGYIWVKGKEIELKSTGNDPFKDEWYQALWDHFSYYYQPVQNIRELTAYLNQTHSLKEELVEYRTKLHQEQNQEEQLLESEIDLFSGVNKN
ncbi:hypothetical protein MJH12_12165 [bacterium]|nr:hypothetical protein [bacterium]